MTNTDRWNTENGAGSQTIILAGATGALGSAIARHLIKRGATVRGLVRKGSNNPHTEALQKEGVTIVAVDYSNLAELKEACNGGACVVSALSGLRDVIIDVQANLLKAAVDAGVQRFIPSDYCIDYTRLTPGNNRNLDLRREFNERLDKAPIGATSILNGMFTDLLTGQAPVILYGAKRIVYWGDATQLLDFTTMDDTAEFTAAAALDPSTPRYLRIAGEETNVEGLQATAAKVAGQPYKLFRAGGLGTLRAMIKVAKTLFPKKKEVFPPWQGMQYLHDMFTGLPKLYPLDNVRYRDIKWTSVAEVIAGKKQL